MTGATAHAANGVVNPEGTYDENGRKEGAAETPTQPTASHGARACTTAMARMEKTYDRNGKKKGLHGDLRGQSRRTRARPIRRPRPKW